jgi:hypothetical protein
VEQVLPRREDRHLRRSESWTPLTHDLAEVIRSVFTDRPSTSCKILCRHFRIWKATCLRILHDALGLKKFHLRWVPHSLTPNQKGERVILSAQLLRELEESQANNFERLITVDESWFFRYYPHESAWVSSREDAPERIRQTIDTEEVLISVFWSTRLEFWVWLMYQNGRPIIKGFSVMLLFQIWSAVSRRTGEGKCYKAIRSI